MSLDLGAIAAAIALRFDPSTISAPSGYQNIRRSTHLLTPGITMPPEVIVFPPTVSWSLGASHRIADADFPVRLYLASPADLSRAIATAYAWYGVLADRLVGQVQLGQSAQGVTHAVWGDSGIGLMAYPDPALLPEGAESAVFVGIESVVRVHLAIGTDFTA